MTQASAFSFYVSHIRLTHDLISLWTQPLWIESPEWLSYMQELLLGQENLAL